MSVDQLALDRSEKPALAGFSVSDVSAPRVGAAEVSLADISRIIEMAWDDRTPFEAIEHQFGLNESAVVWLMRREMKASSFKMWRKRMKSRVTKHAVLRNF
jgi:uncharacterized protein (TIGR03643 family)